MDELRGALEAICHSLNDYLHNIDPGDGAWAVLAPAVAPDGQPNPQARNRIVMCLHNITHEPSVSRFQPPTRDPAGDLGYAMPSLRIDIHLMIAASFDPNRYAEGLAMLSRAMAFLQQSPVLTHANAPGLPRGIDKLMIEPANLDTATVAQVSEMLGTRYVPSLFYRLRGVAIG